MDAVPADRTETTCELPSAEFSSDGEQFAQQPVVPFVSLTATQPADHLRMLMTWFPAGCFQADTEHLLAFAASKSAPSEVMWAMAGLPTTRVYRSVDDLVGQLILTGGQHRDSVGMPLG